MVVRLHEIEDTAKRLHVSVYTVRKWVREGRIAHARIGKRLLFSEEHLQEFIHSRTTPAHSNGSAS